MLIISIDLFEISMIAFFPFMDRRLPKPQLNTIHNRTLEGIKVGFHKFFKNLPISKSKEP